MEDAVLINFIFSHAGKGVVGVAGAAFLLAWPPALPWVAACFLLQFGVRHLALAFREAERETKDHTGITAGAPALDAPDGERGIAPVRNGAAPARSQVQ
jgi:hypothetical protein